jgi:hypothetical protein
MKRALALPVSAAVVGALLAIGVATLGRSSAFSRDQLHVTADPAEPSEVTVDLAEVDRQVAEAIDRMGEIEIDNTPEGQLPSYAEIEMGDAVGTIVHPSERMLELRARVARDLEARQERGGGPAGDGGSAREDPSNR